MTDPLVYVYITNLPEIWAAAGFEDGYDDYIYVCDPDNEVTDVLSDYSIETDLYYFEGETDNIIWGRRSDWLSFCNDYDAVPLMLGFDWDNRVSDTYADWDAIADDVGNGSTSIDLEWPTNGTPPPSMSSVGSFTSSGGTKYSYASNGTITAVSESLNWITTSYTSTTLTITASSNTSTSSRYGYIYVTVGGQSVSVYVYQSGASAPTTKSCRLVVAESGWMDDYSQNFDLQLSMSIGSTTICSYRSFNNGYDFNGTGDKTTDLGTYNVSSSDNLKIYANVMTCTGGTYKLVNSVGNVILSGNMEDLDSTSSSPAGNIPLYTAISNGDTVTLYFEAESSGGSGSGSSPHGVGGTV